MNYSQLIHTHAHLPAYVHSQTQGHCVAHGKAEHIMSLALYTG
jgi:hypothetical protein